MQTLPSYMDKPGPRYISVKINVLLKLQVCWTILASSLPTRALLLDIELQYFQWDFHQTTSLSSHLTGIILILTLSVQTLVPKRYNSIAT